jgi:3-hydroxyisobutyrate dehydrogenase-like beta-hydroxyacid dehydrogenase
MNIARKADLTHPIIVYDMNPERTQDFSARVSHTVVAQSIVEAASLADTICYSVPDDKASLSVLSEILRADLKGKLVVDFGTNHPDTTNQEARLVQQRGGEFVACPVFGVPARAQAGDLIAVLSGSAPAVQQVQKFTKGVIGDREIPLAGEDPGRATQLKVLGNSLILSMVEALAEAFVVAEKCGLGTLDLLRMVELMFPGPFVAYATRFQTGDYYQHDPPIFSVDLARKDARHAQSIAHEAGVTMKNVELADSYLRVEQDARGSSGELAGIYGAKRLEAGLAYKNRAYKNGAHTNGAYTNGAYTNGVHTNGEYKNGAYENGSR